MYLQAEYSTQHFFINILPGIATAPEAILERCPTRKRFQVSFTDSRGYTAQGVIARERLVRNALVTNVSDMARMHIYPIN